MSYNQVSLFIVCDEKNLVEGNICKHVMESLDKIEGITEFSTSNGTNIVNASAKWKESDISQQVIEIKNIQGVVDVKVSKFVQINIKEYIQLSENISGNLKRDPIGQITQAEKDKDYYKALSYACSVFGYYGKQILLSNSILSKSKVDNMTLSCIIQEISNHGKIPADIYEKISVVKKMRNKLEHDKYSIQIDFETLGKCQELVGKALDCVKFLKEQYDKLGDKK